jgi:hypothetical protein
MLTDHSGAGTGGGDNMVKAGECVEYLQGDCLGVSAIARIVGWLAATSLGTRDLDRTPGLLKQLYRGKADRRPKQIHQTGHEKSYTHLGLRL